MITGHALDDIREIWFAEIGVLTGGSVENALQIAETPTSTRHIVLLATLSVVVSHV